MSILKRKYDFVDVRKTFNEHPDCQYYLFYGERGGGKTYSTLSYCIQQHVENGGQFVYMRRYKDDVRRALTGHLFDALIADNLIREYTAGQWTGVKQNGIEFHYTRVNEKGVLELSEEVIGFVVDLAEMERFKGRDFPWVTTIMFDEFISRRGYLPNEFSLFTNMLSTIIRLRTNVRVVMLGNTVSKDCPYFSEMGLSHIWKQIQGTTEIYTYGESDLRVACTYTARISKWGEKESNVYFAFDNPNLDMIKAGAWQMEIYPRIQKTWRPKDVVATFYFVYPPQVSRGYLITDDAGTYIAFTPWTKEVPEVGIVYGQTVTTSDNIHYGLHNQTDKLSRIILALMNAGNVVYATNECGEHVRTFMVWSSTIPTRRWA